MTPVGRHFRLPGHDPHKDMLHAAYRGGKPKGPIPPEGQGNL